MTMIINGVSLDSLFGSAVEFLTYELPAPSLNRFVTVTDNDARIVNRRESVGITTLIVKLVVRGSKEDSYIIKSKIVARLSDVEVNFGGPLTYRVQVASDGTIENKAYNEWLYTLQLQVLDKFGDWETVTTTDSAVSLTNDGSYETPIIIKVTSSIDEEFIAMSGFGAHTIDNPLTIQDITANRTVTIDGRGFITENVGGVEVNKFSSSNIFTFPVLPVGTSTILFTPAGTTKEITFRPRYI